MPIVNAPADCSLRSIRPLHSEMAAAFKADGDLAIDCSAMTSCDITGLQLLISAAKTAETARRPFRVEGVPEVLSTALARAGLQLPSANSWTMRA
jgi:anti-anti-sigma regulatory factor